MRNYLSWTKVQSADIKWRNYDSFIWLRKIQFSIWSCVDESCNYAVKYVREELTNSRYTLDRRLHFLFKTESFNTKWSYLRWQQCLYFNNLLHSIVLWFGAFCVGICWCMIDYHFIKVICSIWNASQFHWQMSLEALHTHCAVTAFCSMAQRRSL